MLIQYPEENWNTFLSQAEADAFMSNMVERGDWDNYTVEQKEFSLTSTASQIRLCKGITLPEDNETDLKEGHGYLLLQAVRVDQTQYDPNDRAVKKEGVGSLQVEYDTNKKSAGLEFPPMSKLYLQQYGCSGSTSFSQSPTTKA